MKQAIAILGLALAAMSFAAPTYGADASKEKKTPQLIIEFADKQAADKQNKKPVTIVKKDAKALAKQKKEQQNAAKKAEKLAKKNHKNSPMTHAVPEIDGSYAPLAVCLLAGAVAIRRERYRQA